MTKTLAASKYPQVPVEFDPQFITHAEEARIPEGEFALSVSNEHPAGEVRGRAILAFLIGFHPQFPVA